MSNPLFDLEERLRESGDSLCDEAAEEIARLRKLLDTAGIPWVNA